jgi:hypothetical protein
LPQLLLDQKLRQVKNEKIKGNCGDEWRS